MQLRLLNFYHFFSNFAVSMVSGFIPLIIYKATQSVLYAMLFIVIMSAVRVVFIFTLRKLMIKKPQIMLLMRLIPIVGYSFALVYIESAFWVCLAVIIVCYAWQVTLKNGCTDAVFAYASDPKKSNSNASFMRIVNNISGVASSILGGIFLGLNSTALILVAAGIYLISVIPLVIFYFVNKKQRSFNKDYTSNVQLAIEKSAETQKSSAKYKDLSKHMILMTLVTTTLAAVGDYIPTWYNLHIFVSGASFATAGYLNALKIAAEIAGNSVGKRLTKRFDNGMIAAITCVGLAATTPFFMIAKANWAIYTIIVLYGFLIELLGYISYVNINKGNVVGLSNDMQLYGRQIGISVGQTLTEIPVIAFASIPMCFYISPIFFVIAAIYWPIKEEQVRKKMVDYLMQNEI